MGDYLKVTQYHNFKATLSLLKIERSGIGDNYILIGTASRKLEELINYLISKLLDIGK